MGTGADLQHEERHRSAPRTSARDRVAGPTLWAAVRERTRAAHDVVEAAMGLPRSASSCGGYRTVLVRLLSAWEPLERQVAGAAWDAVPMDPRLGEAAHLIAGDIARLDVIASGGADAAGAGEAAGGAVSEASPAVPGLEAAGSVVDLGTAIGARYVLLGSALGGRLLAPAIEGELGLGAGEATSFLRRAGIDPAAQWRAFRAGTAAYCDRVGDPELSEEIVQGALAAFAVVTSAFASDHTSSRRPTAMGLTRAQG